MAGLHTALRLNAAAFSRTVAITGDDCPTQRPAARRPQEVTRRGAGPPRSRSPHWSRRLNGRPRAEPSRALRAAEGRGGSPDEVTSRYFFVEGRWEDKLKNKLVLRGTISGKATARGLIHSLVSACLRIKETG